MTTMTLRCWEQHSQEMSSVSFTQGEICSCGKTKGAIIILLHNTEEGGQFEGEKKN